MNKLSKTILIISIALFGAGFLLVNPVYATDNNLVVEVWDGSNFIPLNSNPLFSEANFLPGDSVNRLVRVTNNSEGTQKIGIRIIDKSGCSTDCLSDVLDLAISEGGSTLYSGSLTSFYEAEEKPLSDLGAGSDRTYQFSITFRPPAGNKYQNSAANFDIKIGFFGKEAIGEEITPGGVPGGGSIILPGLQISKEKFIEVGTNSVTITWDTNSLSTSRVIYSPGTISHILEPNNPPNYGYVFSTEEDSAKVLDHSVNITGLLPSTTYYYRCVSHASPPTISREYSFTTLGGKEEIESKKEEKPAEEIGIPEIIKEIPKKIAEEIKKTTEGITPLAPGGVSLPGELVPSEERVSQKGLASMAAAISVVWEKISQSASLIIVITSCLIVLAFIGVREWRLFRKKRMK